VEAVFLGLAAALYTGSAVIAAVMFARARDESARSVQIVFGVALIPHAIAVIVRAVELGSFPISSVHDGILAFSFGAALLAFAIAAKAKIPQVAPLAAPLLALLTVIASFVEPTQSVAEGLRSGWLMVHIALALLGDVAFALAGVVAILYLVQERRLKQKKLPTRSGTMKATGIHVLPPLDTLDRVSMRLIQFGFPLMTLGLISGSLYGKHVWGSYWTWDPRNTISLLVWVLYAVMIQARFMSGWRGRKAAILTVLGVVAILVAFVGLGLLGVGTHGKDYVS